ncbi:MAG: phosphonoacetaldehyde hydrolase [Rhodospirillales bacterium]|nr:phosphonoacetaldehyde hydrolase [Alphaproteobacteria bacterium]MBL6947383.1 phosphonoacetaldehyde hydrolase [Rhodospirillales bacterium]
MQFTHEREFTYNRSYRGPIRAVIFDWAGTTMDFGCMAPAVVFCKVFEEKGVAISMEEARIPMGAHKKVHIGLITEIPSVRRRWVDIHGTEPTSKDVDEMFERFVPLQEACLSEYSTLIPGTNEVIAECRKRGYKIGSTSGYLPGMLAINQADAEKQGYIPDATFGAGDVPRGRPYGHMVLRNILELDVSPVQSVVKVDDTLTGIEEGLNAGGWGVGLAISGNEVGVQLDEWNAMPEDVKQAHRDRIYPTMYQRGAHYVIDSIADMIPVLDDIEARLKRGEKP